MDLSGESASLTDQEDEDWMDTKWSDPDAVFSCKSGENDADTSYGGTHTLERAQSCDRKKSCDSVQSCDTVKSCDTVQSRDGTQIMSGLQLNDNKAGMEGLDKEKINKIIFDASKGSKYFENERKKEEQMNKRIKQQNESVKRITDAELKQATVEADRLLEELDGRRELDRMIVHVDMDAFYAAVETRDNPSLRDKPIAVGSTSMLSTSNYHARKFGVRAAMPGFIGKKLCPELVIVRLNFKQYTAVSNQVRDVLALYDPNFCPMSLDEAYLDFTNHVKKRQSMSAEDRTVICRICDPSETSMCLCDLNLSKSADKDGVESNLLEPEGQGIAGVGNTAVKFQASKREVTLSSQTVAREITQNSQTVKGEATSLCNRLEGKNCHQCGKPLPPFEDKIFDKSVEDAVREMRCRIEQRTQLTASAGIASNMMLAKVCSDKNKPNGQFRIQPTRESIMDFVKELPIRKIPGIGKVSEKMLNAVGVVTCDDLYHKRALLYHLYSPISFNYFMRICLGMGSTVVDRDGERKSMSTERTFNEINSPTDQYNKCSDLCQSLANDLKEAELKGRTVTLKLKTVKFDVKTRALTLPAHTSDFHTIYTAASELLKTEIQTAAPDKLRLRLMGVRMSNLVQQSQCQSVKQDTITGMFRKMTSKPLPDNRSDTDQTRSDAWEQIPVHGTEDVSISPYSLKDIIANSDNVGRLREHVSDGEDQKGTDQSDDRDVMMSPCKPLFKKKRDATLKDKMVGTSYKSNSQGRDKSKDYDISQLSGTLQEDVPDSSEQGVTIVNTLNSVADDSKENVSSISQKCVADNSQTVGRISQDIDVVQSVVHVQRAVDISQRLVDVSQNHTSEGRDKSMSSITSQDHTSEGSNKSITSVTSQDHTSEGRDKSTTSVLLGDKSQNMETYECPVCFQTVVCKNLNYFNDHVDICLFKQITATSSSQVHSEPVSSTTGQTGNESSSQGKTESRVSTVEVESQSRDVTYSSKTDRSTDTIGSNSANVDNFDSITVTSLENGSIDHLAETNHTKTITSVLSMMESTENNCKASSKHNKSHTKPLAGTGSTGCERASSLATGETTVVQQQPAVTGCNISTISLPTSELTAMSQQSNLSVHEDTVRNNCNSDCSSSCGGSKQGDGQLEGCEEGDESSFFVCPVCNAEKQGWDIAAFNTHVDACLSRTTIKEILREQENNHRKTKSKRNSSELQSGSLAKKGRQSSSKDTRNIKTYFTA